MRVTKNGDFFSKDTNTIISSISGIATIIASIIAILTLLIWRKQQLYSEKFRILMELEDSYELLFNQYYENFNWFYQIFKLSLEATEQNTKLIHDKIIKDFEQFKMINQSAVYEKNYQLSYARATRLDIGIELIESLKFEKLKSFSTDNMNMLNNDNFSSEAQKEELNHKFANNFCKLKNEGHEHFKKIRKSI